MINSGKLRHVISIQSESITRNSFGEEVPTWAAVMGSSSVRAKVRTLKEEERFVSNQTASEIEKEFIIRYRSGIEPKMRVVYNSENFNIESIDPDDEHSHKMRILCSKVGT